MPWLDIAVAAGLIATLIVGFATRKRSRIPVIATGAATLALLVTAIWMEGTRWQVVLLAVSGVLVAGMVVWTRSGRLRVLSRVSGTFLLAGLVVLAGAAWALPPMLVPAPTGPQAVGVTSTMWVDDTRDTRGVDGVDGVDGQRSLPATVWYPTSAPGKVAPYLLNRDRVAAVTGGLASQYGMPALLFDGLAHANANATEDAAPSHGSFPVVIASPGSGSTRWLMTSWAEEVASHGFIVIGIDHPYDSAGAELADGTTAGSELVATGDDDRDQAAADAAAAIRAEDIRAVIDQLERGNTTVPALESADLSLIIAAGHSLGGAAAVEAGRQDERIDGVIDIDGMPRSPTDETLDCPVVFLVAGDTDPNPNYDLAVKQFLTSTEAVRVTLDGVAHLGFVDAGLVLAPVPTLTGVRGTEGPRLTARATLVLLDALTSGETLNQEALSRIGTLG